MKVLGYISVILVAGVLGFALYPTIYPTLVQAGWIQDYRSLKPVPKQSTAENGGALTADSGPTAGVETPAAKPEPKSEPPAPAVEKPATDSKPDEAEILRRLAGVTPERLPEKILLKAPVTVSDAASGTKMKIEPGGRIKPVRIEGVEVVVSPAPGFEGRVAVVETDLLEQLRTASPAPEAKPEPPPVAAQPEAKKPVPVPEPAPVPEPEPKPAPPVAGGQPAGQPAPPAEAPAQPEPAKPSGNAAEIVNIMKDSIRSGQIKEFTYDQVIGWKGGGEEEIEGETYQTGLVAYKAKTIFGVNTIKAKALIKDGKVVKWIWPKSGMEIK